MSLGVRPATATDGLVLQAERKGQAPNTSPWWKHLFSTRQLFAFPAYWMSSGGYRSFAECIINRWTSRSALILRNGRNVESGVDTHIPSSSCCCCSRQCVDWHCSACRLCVHICVRASLLYTRVCGLHVCGVQLWGRRIPLWPFPCITDSHGVIWLPVNAWLSALDIELQGRSWMAPFVPPGWVFHKKVLHVK